MALKVFKNITFKKRDYEATNVVFAVGETSPDGEMWVEASEFEAVDNDIEFATNTTHLYSSKGVKYYGYL